MLILAGVSINLVVGNNGIITKARDARDKTEQAKANEEQDLLRLQDELEIALGEKEEPPAKVAVGNKATSNSTIDGKYASATNPIIPEGYIPIDTGTTSWGDGSSAPTEENVNKGLVIKDESGNEWVWVPVDNTTLAGMYETASTPITLTGGGAITDETVLNPLKQIKISKYSKSITITNNDNSTTTKTRVLPNDTSSFREPDVVVTSSGTSHDAVDTNRATAGFTKTVGETTTTMTLAEMADMMRSEYETMIASIEKYHGFYIGRYELNVNGEEKTGATLTNKNWYYLYNQCKGLSASNKVMSRMIWGCQWDVTCNWIANYGDKKNISDSSTWGNYSNYNTANSYSNGDTGYVSGAGSKQNTGSSEYWKANNIYDFAGNCYEWTQEANSTSGRAIRGGRCSNFGSSYPASDRFSGNPTGDVSSDLRFSSHFNSATLSN